MNDLSLQNNRDDLAVNTVGIFATSLFEIFGEDALHVAEQQMAASELDSRDKWTEIVSHLARKDF